MQARYAKAFLYKWILHCSHNSTKFVSKFQNFSCPPPAYTLGETE